MKSAYELFKFDSGTYDGDLGAFSSQYTIGHEMGIWDNSDLDLSPLALKVAVNDITIKEYFDIVFLNYIQPVDGIYYNLVYLVTSFMVENNLSSITKEDLRKVFDFASNNTANDINGLYNFLICTSYFSAEDRNTLKIEYTPSSIKNCCNLKYHLKNQEEIGGDLDDLKSFVLYLQEDNRSLGIINSLRIREVKQASIPNKSFKFELNTDEDYDESKLASILKKYYKKLGSIGIHLFAIDYCEIINDFNKKEILENANIPTSYEAEINKGIKIGNELNNAYGRKNIVKDSPLVGFNKIYYGIPGCGKSYKVASMLEYKDDFRKEAEANGIYCPVPEDYIFRTTFYLDYSNSDFIGQIYPVVKGDNVEYEPIPGPFTKALAKALLHPNEMVYIVIEEINRGNAAAIFGDLFQLLDRLKNPLNGMSKGASEYPISNEFIESYFDRYNEGKITIKGETGIIPFTKGKIYIPNNLTILATMNTSDQNVFPLDTAFKRRWIRERIVAKWEDVSFANLCIPFTDWTWGKFAQSVNVTMISDSKEGTITEDKNLGPYFVNADMLVEQQHRYDYTEENRKKLINFVNNVIDYLFLDVAKFEQEVLFNSDLKYDDVYNTFMSMIKSDVSEEEALYLLTVFANKIEPDVNDNISKTKKGLNDGSAK